ncbi:MAG: cyclic nucleotide-binding domain-containing protein [Myxococcales bacterium]|nr:cyclic nucleotide-binding domain-containing protein [Myxococcales bacterium]
MTVTTRQALLREAEHALRTRDPRRALVNLIALLRSAPHDLDARMRVADVLLASGRLPLAVECYSAVAIEAAKMGYPLKAAAALKVLANFDPGADQLFTALAARYAYGSASLGRAVRASPPSPEAEVGRNAFPPDDFDDTALAGAAARLVISRDGLPDWPAMVPPVPLLSELPADAFSRLLAAAELRRLPRGATLMQQGEAGDAFYLLVKGRVAVTRAGAVGAETLAELGEGALLGEMALLSNAPRNATVTALDDVDALAFGRDALAAASRELAAIGSVLERFMRQRLLDHLMRTHPLFEPFDPTQRVQLASRFEVVSSVAGAMLIREGDPARGLWVILSGGVAVSRVGPEGAVTLAELGPGEIFGEMSLLDRAPTNATVTTLAPSTLLLLPETIFHRLVGGVPELRGYFEELAEARRMDTRITLSLVPGSVWAGGG